MQTLFDGCDKRALVIAAHLDDEVLGMGGTIDFLSKKGFEVCVLVLSSKTTVIVPDVGRDVDLKSSTTKIAKILGISRYYFLNFIDGRVGNDMPTLIGGVENLVSSFKPSLVFSHCRYDANQDHRAGFRVSEIMCRLFRRKDFLRAVLNYEVLSSTNFAVGAQQFAPSIFVEVDIEKKLQAVDVYDSEMDPVGSSGGRNTEGVKLLCGFRGQQIGVSFAEGFELLKMSIPKGETTCV